MRVLRCSSGARADYTLMFNNRAQVRRAAGEFRHDAVALPVKPRLWSEHEVVEIFRRKARHVLTFLGFAELGYQDEAGLHRIIAAELARYAPHTTIVNTGTLVTLGFPRGIVAVYEQAQRMGFPTTGIHSSLALTSSRTHALSPCVDEVFFLLDDTWGGVSERTGTPSPTLRTLIAVTDEAVVIGGGKHAAEEMQAFARCDKPPRFYPMEMHHATSRRSSRSGGLDAPDFRGAAYHAWVARQDNI